MIRAIPITPCARCQQRGAMYKSRLDHETRLCGVCLQAELMAPKAAVRR